jgi:hypothetical protein
LGKFFASFRSQARRCAGALIGCLPKVDAPITCTKIPQPNISLKSSVHTTLQTATYVKSKNTKPIIKFQDSLLLEGTRSRGHVLICANSWTLLFVF